jgi:sortase (surface protein transpeptidase)
MRTTNLTSRARRRFALIAAVLGVALVGVALFGFAATNDTAEGRIDRPAVRAGRAPATADDLDLRRHPARRPAVTTTTARAPRAKTAITVPRPALEPVAVRVPAVGINSVLVRLGLNPDNTLQVPSDYSVAGWYIHRPVPGEGGPSIIAGHVDSKSGPAVFYRLRELQPGTAIEVERNDGSVAVFTVTAREQYDKDAFPSERVYGPTPTPELRMITCGGSFDRSIGHYTDNVVVFAAFDRII